jgi:hypothetical protein
MTPTNQDRHRADRKEREVSNDKRAADDAEREKFNAWFKSEHTRMAVSPSFACKAWARAAWQAALSSRADGGKDSSHHDPSWQEGYKEGYDDSRLVALDEAAKVAYSHNAIMATTTAQLIEKAIRALIGVKK